MRVTRVGSRILIACVLSLIGTSPAFATSFVDFSMNCWVAGSNDMVEPGCHSSSHITGGGNLMEVWSETVGVVPDSNYLFSAWVDSNDPASPIPLGFSINGSLLGITFGPAVGSWELLEAEWNSGASTTATLAILAHHGVGHRKDLALGEVAFDGPAPLVVTDEPSSLLLLATGLAGTVAGFRRRRG